MGVIFEVDDIVQTMSAAPSGNLLMYRSIDPDTGDTKLYLADRHEPGETERVAIDAEPGIESLHPVAGRNFDLNDDLLTFVAQDAGAEGFLVDEFGQQPRTDPFEGRGCEQAGVVERDVVVEVVVVLGEVDDLLDREVAFDREGAGGFECPALRAAEDPADAVGREGVGEAGGLDQSLFGERRVGAAFGDPAVYGKSMANQKQLHTATVPRGPSDRSVRSVFHVKPTITVRGVWRAGRPAIRVCCRR